MRQGPGPDPEWLARQRVAAEKRRAERNPTAPRAQADGWFGETNTADQSTDADPTDTAWFTD